MNVVTFLLCEDIRQEVGNKLSLMGVYRDHVTLQNARWPVAIRLGIFTRINLEANEPTPDGFRVTLDLEGEKVAQLAGTFVVKDREKPIELALVAGVVRLTQFGTLSCIIELLKDDAVSSRADNFHGSTLGIRPSLDVGLTLP